ncbi:hypothetical protein SLEP1_g18220 [Rubroshorea leprosula]|uniref:Uncharacterized protein n=1 Tax=Rubroshorea leprosula TaxID=152421 RepID=A0AAV5J2A8_9ROSI|nr:hypothetical protein SLEP1_g18220 [Rubroshorea leprosula]
MNLISSEPYAFVRFSHKCMASVLLSVLGRERERQNNNNKC